MEDAAITPWCIYDAVGDRKRWFPMKFRKYVREEELLCRNKHDCETVWFFEKKPQRFAHDDVITSGSPSLADNIRDLVGNEIYIHPHCLVQFWRAEEVPNNANDFGERRFQLSTRNQPFLLVMSNFVRSNQMSEELCLYRMKTRDVIITGDGKGGPISRVFKNKRMEITPDVAYYSYEEHPQRDMARSCRIKCSLIVPFLDSYGRVIGVIEVVLKDWPLYFIDGFLSRLPKNYPMYLDPCEGLCGQYDIDKDSLRIAVSEIKEVMEVLCETFDIRICQTWMLCKHCNSLSTSVRCAEELSASYQCFYKDKYLQFGPWCVLREGEGVVGRAAMSSHNLVYCEDVAKFSITEYPLAHFVRFFNLSASFAICLQSNLSGDQVYVLEFFLGSSYGNWGLRKKLIPILDKMRQSFRTFEVAYGGVEIGENLFVQVIDASFPDKVETLTIDLNLAIGVKNVEDFDFPYYFGQNSRNETDDPMIGVESPFQDISMNNGPVASASTVQSEIIVTVKANYGGDFVRFQLSASSGIHELNCQVSQRLELMEGAYELSYRDEDNDPILLTCDEDLQLYISNSTKNGNYTLLVWIEPKCASPM